MGQARWCEIGVRNCRATRKEKTLCGSNQHCGQGYRPPRSHSPGSSPNAEDPLQTLCRLGSSKSALSYASLPFLPHPPTSSLCALRERRPFLSRQAPRRWPVRSLYLHLSPRQPDSSRNRPSRGSTCPRIQEAMARKKIRSLLELLEHHPRTFCDIQ